MRGILETDIEELMDFIKENNLAQKFVDWKFRRKESNQSPNKSGEKLVSQQTSNEIQTGQTGLEQ